MFADARHSWLDALSSAGALARLIAVALGQPWGDPVAGLAVTVFICHVGIIHAHARARWTGRTLRLEIEGWVSPDQTTRDADAIGRQVAGAVSDLPEAGSLTWISRAAPE